MKEKVAFRELNFATDYRVFSLDDPFSNASTSYFHKSLGGYHGAKLKTYQELISFYLMPEYGATIDILKNNPTYEKIDSLLKNGTPVLNMLNTKYIIYNPDAKPILNPYRFGNVWFASRVKLVANADEEILALAALDKNTAIIQSRYKKLLPDKMETDTTARIALLSYKPNELQYKSQTQSDQLAVFSEIYYPAGWNAYIDGSKVPYLKADYALRALRIPKGKHLVEFKFEPATYYLCRKISYAGSGLLLVFIICMVLFDLGRKRRTSVQQE